MLGTKKNKALLQRSVQIVSLFKKTIDELSKVNSEAQVVITSNKDSINKLYEEKEELSDLIEKNHKVISNVNSLLA